LPLIDAAAATQAAVRHVNIAARLQRRLQGAKVEAEGAYVSCEARMWGAVWCATPDTGPGPSQGSGVLLRGCRSDRRALPPSRRCAPPRHCRRVCACPPLTSLLAVHASTLGGVLIGQDHVCGGGCAAAGEAAAQRSTTPSQRSTTLSQTAGPGLTALRGCVYDHRAVGRTVNTGRGAMLSGSRAPPLNHRAGPAQQPLTLHCLLEREGLCLVCSCLCLCGKDRPMQRRTDQCSL
jgi:hypothetical protein